MQARKQQYYKLDHLKKYTSQTQSHCQKNPQKKRLPPRSEEEGNRNGFGTGEVVYGGVGGLGK